MSVNVQYLTDANGHRTAVIISMEDWGEISQYLEEQNKLSELSDSIKDAMEEVKAMKSGNKEEVSLNDFLNEL